MLAEELSAVPTLAGDAMRVTNRLPGVSSVGASARPRVRGGLQDELLVVVDGVWFVPFIGRILRDDGLGEGGTTDLDHDENEVDLVHAESAVFLRHLHAEHPRDGKHLGTGW